MTNSKLTVEKAAKIDFQALREAAEKATPGPWRAFRYDSGICGVGGGESFEILVCERISSNRPEDAKFIAAAHPAAVLALLDELERENNANLNLMDAIVAKDKHIADLEATVAHANAGWKEAQEQEARAEAAERRIAELEARTVVIPDDLDFDCEFENGEYGIADEPWLRGRVDGFNTSMKLITKAIRAAGITVKGE